MTENLPSDNTPKPEPTRRDNLPWLGGAILILVGIFFLAQNLTGFTWNNWWALFILIPAIGSLAQAWRIYQTHGRWTAAARGPLIGGLILLFVTAMFLFSLDWGRLWPLFIIIAGLGALASALMRD